MTTLSTEPDQEHREMAGLLAEVLAMSIKPSEVDPVTRVQLMDLLGAPRGPVQRADYIWEDVAPGLKLHLVSEDPARGVRRCLVWGAPGSMTPRHGHSGDEVILVLEGHLKDHRGSYGPGDICRSTAKDVHQEQVVGDADYVCFVVYYGDLIPA